MSRREWIATNDAMKALGYEYDGYSFVKAGSRGYTPMQAFHMLAQRDKEGK